MELPTGKGPFSTAIRDHDTRIGRLEGTIPAQTVGDSGPRGRVIMPRARTTRRNTTSTNVVPRWG